jgi:hypothetical protein
VIAAIAGSAPGPATAVVAAATCRNRGAGGRGRAGGQGLVEYGLILALVAVVCVVSLVFFGDQLSSLLSLIAQAV